MKKIITSFILALSLIACGQQNKEDQKIEKPRVKNEKLHVISSFSIISDMILEIAKDRVLVHNLIPLGTDPHEYEPVPEDIKFASSADVFFYNGLNLEGGEDGWFFKLMNTVKAPKELIVNTGQNIQAMYLDDAQKEVNPHVFIDPANGAKMARVIGEKLMELDLANHDFYKRNMEIYVGKIEILAKRYEEKLAQLKEEEKILVTSERAFQYLSNSYDLTEAYIWAIDTEENGSPAQIKNTIELVRKLQPKALFVESNVDTRPMQTISKETGVPIYKYPLYSDELGRQGKEAGSYLDYLNYNLEHITKGLSGKE